MPVVTGLVNRKSHDLLIPVLPAATYRKNPLPSLCSPRVVNFETCSAVNVANCTPSVAAYAANNAPGMTFASSVFSYSSGASCGISGYASGSEVTASYAFQPLVVGLIPELSITLTASSCHP